MPIDKEKTGLSRVEVREVIRSQTTDSGNLVANFVSNGVLGGFIAVLGFIGAGLSSDSNYSVLKWSIFPLFLFAVAFVLQFLSLQARFQYLVKQGEIVGDVEIKDESWREKLESKPKRLIERSNFLENSAFLVMVVAMFLGIGFLWLAIDEKSSTTVGHIWAQEFCNRPNSLS